MSEKKSSHFDTIIKPIVTEKSALVGSSDSEKSGSTVVFEVQKEACKTKIKNAVQRAFSVEVSSVNTMTYKGKIKRVGRSSGRCKSFKKAVVTLKPGFKIDVVEGV